MEENQNLLEKPVNLIKPYEVSEFDEIEIEELEGGSDEVLWKRRRPRPYEIIVCDRGYMPYGDHKLCEFPGCA